MKPKILLVYKTEPPHSLFKKEHQRALRKIETILQDAQLPYKKIPRERLKNLTPYSFIITVGGDGTFLHASHFAQTKHLLLGVNSVPEMSHGAYCAATPKTFARVLRNFLDHKSQIALLQRLQISIGSRKISTLALNDVLFSNPSPAGTARYELKLIETPSAPVAFEAQKSSGVWISTASGSTAAIHSAGGRVLSKTSPQFQFVVREPFLQGKHHFKKTRGILGNTACLKIRSRMAKACVFIDGAHQKFTMKFGEELKIEMAKHPLKILLK